MRLIDDDPSILADYMQAAPVKHKVSPASDWTKAAIDYFYKPDDTPKIYLPWTKTHTDFHFREGEVSLWGGISSHGKSVIVGQAMLGLMHQCQKVAIASLEMLPVVTLARMQCQAWGGDRPNIDFIKQFGVWTDGKMWVYDHVGSTTPETMLAVIRYAVDKFGVQHFVVDNLTKVIDGDQGEKVYNQQKDFVDSLCEIANSTKVHIHLVAHIRKAGSETAIPGKFDLKGSGSLSDLVDNIFIIWRNKEKEQSVRDGDGKLADAPDAILKIDKQRNNGTEGSYHLWFDRGSCQYLESRHALPRRMDIETGVPVEEIFF